ncbi:MAG: protein kinase [Gemmatimonadota bacterium]
MAQLPHPDTDGRAATLSLVLTLPQTCAKCGTRIADDAVFCSKCGLNLTLEHSRMIADAPDVSETFARLRTALVDRYVLDRELGRGGMATVFLARDVKHDREVAIKVLHPDLAASLGGERFLREIRLAAKLQHPHILGMYDSGTSGDLMYYMMPFIRGESLRDKIDREGMLPVEDALRITMEVADALGYAHAQGVVHRDIKPENILLSGEHALVADFGIASAVSDAGTQKLTQTGMAVGTPVYMAPEQASGEGAGPSADLYSLGCMLYEMLAGEPPFTGPNSMAIMARHLMEQVPSIRIVRNAVPEEVENAIFYALQKMPVDRPQTAAQLVECLSASVGGTSMMRAMRSTTTMRRPTMMEQPVLPPVAWWKRPATFVGAAAILLLAGGAAYGNSQGWFSKSAAAGAGDSGANSRRIAVLYFNDLSADSSLTAVADGLTEGLIQTLGTSPSLTIISKGGVTPYRGTELGVDGVANVASTLRVGYIVRGDVEPSGEKVNLTVRLDDESGASVARKVITVPRSNLLGLQDSVTRTTSELIKEQLKTEILVKEQRAATTSEQAWLLLQRGARSQKRADELRGSGDMPGAEREFAVADSLFAGAEKADAAWSTPVTRRALLAYRRSRLTGGDQAKIREWVATGIAHADRAIALNANDADAFEARGTLRYWSWLQNLETDAGRKLALLETSKKDLERATELNNLQASAFASLSHLYYQDPAKTTSDVLLAAKQAMAADEFLSNANVVLGRLFNASYDLGQFDPAQQYCTQLGQRFPADPRSKRCQLYMMTTTRASNVDMAAAWRLADTLVTMAPADGKEAERDFANMLMAAVLARASKTTPVLADSARRLAKRSGSDATLDPARDAAYLGAFVYTTLGDTTDAIRMLKAYVAANPERASSLRDEAGWWFRPIQANSAFRALVGASP